MNAGQQLGRIVVSVGSHAADDREFIGDAGVLRQQFADIKTGNIGRNRQELTAILLRCLGLEIVHIQMTRPARQVNHDQSFLVRRRPSAPFRPDPQ